MFYLEGKYKGKETEPFAGSENGWRRWQFGGDNYLHFGPHPDSNGHYGNLTSLLTESALEIRLIKIAMF